MKTMIAIPCMDTVQMEFAESLVKMNPVGLTVPSFQSGSLIYDSRNSLARRAVDEKTDFVLWLDSDMVFQPDLLNDLMADAEKGMSMVCGLFHMRRPPYRPCLYKVLRQGLTADENTVEHYDDHPKDEPFQIEGCGFAAVLMRTEVLMAVFGKYHQAFSPLPGFGEDLSFCIRARGCGYKLWCDPRVKVGHKAHTIVTEHTFDAYRQVGDIG